MENLARKKCSIMEIPDCEWVRRIRKQKQSIIMEHEYSDMEPRWIHTHIEISTHTQQQGWNQSVTPNNILMYGFFFSCFFPHCNRTPHWSSSHLCCVHRPVFFLIVALRAFLRLGIKKIILYTCDELMWIIDGGMHYAHSFVI